MIPKGLGILLIVIAVGISFLYAKMILIWRDVMLKRNEQIKKDMERLRDLRSKQLRITEASYDCEKSEDRHCCCELPTSEFKLITGEILCCKCELPKVKKK